MKLPGRRVTLAVTACCLVVAISTLVAAGLVGNALQSPAVRSLLLFLASVLPVVGLVVSSAVIWRVVRARSRGIAAGPTDQRDNKQVVGYTLQQRLSEATADWYRCEAGYTTTNIREQLEESAARAVTTTTGVDEETAQETLAAGTWTDDPVAAAFLSAQCRQPLGERLKGALDPGQAFRRRVDRTITAIEVLEGQTVSRQPDELDGTDEQPTEVAAR
ncbi:DUF7269 family protein [Halovenus salina]|uniref:DUF7269 family protein n=1 Tax=Halovenus salina TaxID=1510225 RepID=UPI002260EBD0|nr:hypothetical protein [Halovenus salina]